MAVTNVALDLLGQATLWLSLAAEIEGSGRDEDQLAFLRDAHAFRNVLLVEQPNGDYGDTLMRQFFFDAWHYFFLQALHHSADTRVAAIAEKSIKEVRYHLRRSGDLIVRLGDGSAESHARLQRSGDQLWMYTGELFAADALDTTMTQQGIAPDLAQLRQSWLAHVGEIFQEASLRLPDPSAWMQSGGKTGRHSEHLGFLLAEMQFLQRAYPDSTW